MSDFDELLGVSSGRSSRRSAGRKRAARKSAGRTKATYLRYDPDTGEKARVTRDDDRYDEWLTASAYKKAAKDDSKTTKETDGVVKQFAKDVAKDVLKDLRRPTRGNRRARKRIAEDVASVTNVGSKSVLTKALPLAMRLGVVAAVIGASWWAVKTLQGRAVRKKVEAEIAAVEARLKRPLTQKELEALLPQYEAWFKTQVKMDQVKSLSKL